MEPVFEDVIDEPQKKKKKVTKIAAEPVETAKVTESATVKRKKAKKVVKVEVESQKENEVVSVEKKPKKEKKKKVVESEKQENEGKNEVNTDVANDKIQQAKDKKKEKKKLWKKKLSFESVEAKFSDLLEKLSKTTSRFQEGEELVKKEVEEKRVTENESEVLLRVYARNLRVEKHRQKISRKIGEFASLELLKKNLGDLVSAGKVTKNDAALIVKKWKTREIRRIGRQEEKQLSLVCFHCREVGHRLADCPQKKSSDGAGVCFKCGSTEHDIYKCNKKNIKGFPYATCFLCKEMGHLSRDCHQNSKGIYPDGGKCMVCGSNKHLKRDCPELAAQKKGVEEKREFKGRSFNAMESADVDYDPTAEVAQKKDSQKKAKHIKF